ncbi:MAG: putative serine/threonine protein kinase [Myxococcales bacterium]|nr:putative serine/threonine protein kinase [Myxococcales bacterium]
MRTEIISASLLSLLFLPGAARADDWTALRADGSGSRASQEVSGTSFTAAWTYATKHGGHLIATPVSADGLVVAAGTEGDVAALGLEDGRERWARTVDGTVGSTPAVRGGQVVTSTLNGQLYALDLRTGAVNWQRAFGGVMNYSSPTIIATSDGGPGSMVLPSNSPTHNLLRISLATGDTEWGTGFGAIADIMYTSAALIGDQAVIGMNGGRYQSLDVLTGATRWIFDAVGPVYFASPLVVGDTVYMFPGDAQSQLFAVDVETGRAVPGFPLSIADPEPVLGDGMLGRGPVTSPTMTAGGLIIFQLRRQDMHNTPGTSFKVEMREYVVAVDPKLMKVAWQHPVGHVTVLNANGVPELNTCPTPAAFATANGPVLVASSSISPRVVVLDVATGEERWSAALSGAGRSSPIFSNGMVLVGTDAGVLHAFSSDVNRAPAVPSGLVVAGGAETGPMTLTWNAAVDPEGQAVSYVVRAIAEGDLTTNTVESETTPGQTTLSIVPRANTTYEVSVRARDASGALSAPTESLSFHRGAAAPTPEVGSPDTPANVAPAAAPALPAPPVQAPPSEPSTAPPTASTTSPSPSGRALDFSPAASSSGCSLGGGNVPGRGGALGVVLALLIVARRRDAAGRDRKRAC